MKTGQKNLIKEDHGIEEFEGAKQGILHLIDVQGKESTSLGAYVNFKAENDMPIAPLKDFLVWRQKVDLPT